MDRWVMAFNGSNYGEFGRTLPTYQDAVQFAYQLRIELPVNMMVFVENAVGDGVDLDFL